MVLETTPRNWYRGEYLVSTEPQLIQVEAVNAAMDSDLMWWAQGLPGAEIKKALHNSLCLGLYVLPEATSQIAGQGGPRQVGLVRLVTDDVTFAYLTDVYILPEHQGKGLGRWLMECLDEVIKGWAHLRRFMLLVSDKMDFYRKHLGAKDWSECNTAAISIGLIEGPAVKRPEH
ncbi:hypothetical protein GGS23DRAFT_364026 [Durotheca rogersii]|uniref:uncharacterized protein n=1 Tax=Durotheca rogersii TaxID=419775 RepID=UPI00221E510C|nr:uncharacterized protein GGS23DRAFT_364026 [Durotheca rogersii]KAI5866002.1 hypothetical protein GGS23DRAFT_364026 [Durotheca rogersii]